VSWPPLPGWAAPRPVEQKLSDPADLRASWEIGFEAALKAARQAWELSGDVPVGAVVLAPDGGLLASGGNERELTGDPTAHAEIVALRRAARRWANRLRPDCLPTSAPTANPSPAAPGRWRLDGCTLVVTLEPCAMCAGAALAARVSRLVYGADDPKAGAVASLFDLTRDPRLPCQLDLRRGFRADDGAALLREFFASRRPSTLASPPSVSSLP